MGPSACVGGYMQAIWATLLGGGRVVHPPFQRGTDLDCIDALPLCERCDMTCIPFCGSRRRQRSCGGLTALSVFSS